MAKNKKKYYPQLQFDKLTECPNRKGYYLINLNTGELAELNCNTYDCPYCGPRKMAKLKKAVYNCFSTMDYVRLFTFTFRYTYFINQEHCIIRSREIWRRFINNIRRDKKLSEKQRNFQYFKIVEFHETGYPHFHVLCDNYLHQSVLIKHWQKAIRTVMGWTGNCGTVNAKGSRNAQRATHYVSKYVTKTALAYEKYNLQKIYNYDRRRFRLYSKSSKLQLFYKRMAIHRWQFEKGILVKDGDRPEGAILTCPFYSQLPPDLLYFELNLPPPITYKNYNTPFMLKEYKIWADFRNRIYNNISFTI